MNSVAVLGSANMDLVVQQSRPPAPGETIFGTRFSMGAGGKGLNQAIAAARAGAEVTMIAAVGADAFGEKLTNRLAEEGIDISRVRTTGLATGVAQISVTDDGENTIVVVSGANDSAVLDDADRAVIAAASHLVVQLERPTALLREAMTFARSAGVVTVLTPAPVRPDAGELIELTDLLVPNEGEALDLSGATDAEAAARALSERVGTVVVTLGGRGAIVAAGGEVTATVPPRIVTPIDTTAAGDTFVGFLVAALARGAELADALTDATLAASLTVTRPGAADSIPTRAEADAAGGV